MLKSENERGVLYEKTKNFSVFLVGRIIFLIPIVSAKAETTENTEQDEKCIV